MIDREESAVVSRVLEGERDAFAFFVDRYKGPIFNLAYRLTGSREDAHDLAQETFLRAYGNLGRFDRKKKFFTWLYTIALNLIRNHRKRNSRLPRNGFDGKTGCAAVPEIQNNDSEQKMIDAESVRMVERAMERIPHDFREALLLRFHQELSFEDIAAVLEISQSGAKMRVYRGVELLRRLIDDE